MGSGSGGEMMGSGNVSTTAGANSGWGGADTAMVVMMGVLIAVVVGALAVWRAWRRRPGDAALETLQARYARGDIDQQSSIAAARRSEARHDRAGDNRPRPIAGAFTTATWGSDGRS